MCITTCHLIPSQNFVVSATYKDIEGASYNESDYRMPHRRMVDLEVHPNHYGGHSNQQYVQPDRSYFLPRSNVESSDNLYLPTDQPQISDTYQDNFGRPPGTVQGSLSASEYPNVLASTTQNQQLPVGYHEGSSWPNGQDVSITTPFNTISTNDRQFSITEPSIYSPDSSGKYSAYYTDNGGVLNSPFENDMGSPSFFTDISNPYMDHYGVLGSPDYPRPTNLDERPFGFIGGLDTCHVDSVRPVNSCNPGGSFGIYLNSPSDMNVREPNANADITLLAGINNRDFTIDNSSDLVRLLKTDE
jgi:hypothetical protein